MHPKDKKSPKVFHRTRSKPYFCLDTSRSRTLAYAHWYKWGNVLENVMICSHLRLLATLFSHEAPRSGTGLVPRSSVLILHVIWT